MVVGERRAIVQWYDATPYDIRAHLRIRSFARYDAAVRLHIVPTLGKAKLARLTQQQLESLYAAKLKEGLSRITELLMELTPSSSRRRRAATA